MRYCSATSSYKVLIKAIVYLRISEIIHNRIIEPITANRIVSSNPPNSVTCNTSTISQPPMNEPTRPMMRFKSSPLPEPLKIKLPR